MLKQAIHLVVIVQFFRVFAAVDVDEMLVYRCGYEDEMYQHIVEEDAVDERESS